jgi:hypothetical protein
VRARGHLIARCREQLFRAGGVALQPRLHEPKRNCERDKPLLRTVVQVSLESPTRLVTRLNETCA